MSECGSYTILWTNSAITVSQFASITRVVVTFNHSLATYIKQKVECNTLTVCVLLCLIS